MDFNKEPDAIVDIPPNVVGWVIGKAGTRINDMQYRTNASVSGGGNNNQCLCDGRQLPVE